MTTQLTFDQNVRGVPAPRRWVLAAWNVTSDTGQQDPDVTAVLPVPDDVPIETHLAMHGGLVGHYRVQLCRVGARNLAAERHALDRLQERGPVVAQLEITPANVDAAAALKKHAAASAAAAAPRTMFGRPGLAATPEPTSAVKSAQESLELQKLENERRRQELEQKRIERDLARLEKEQPAAVTGSPFAGVAAILTPFVPLVVQAVQGFLETQRKTAETLAALLERQDSAPAPAMPVVPVAAGLSIADVVGLMPQLRQLGKFLGLAGGGGGDEDEPKSDTLQMIEAVKGLLGELRSAGGPAPAAAEVPQQVAASVPVAAAPSQNGHAPRNRITPQNMMSLRVTRFLTAVVAELQATADPGHAADKLFPHIGALPEKFRNLLASSTNVDALLTGLPEWLPGAYKVQLPNMLRNDASRKAWVQRFLETIHEIANESAPDGGGDLVGADGGDDGEG